MNKEQKFKVLEWLGWSKLNYDEFGTLVGIPPDDFYLTICPNLDSLDTYNSFIEQKHLNVICGTYLVNSNKRTIWRVKILMDNNEWITVDAFSQLKALQEAIYQLAAKSS